MASKNWKIDSKLRKIREIDEVHDCRESYAVMYQRSNKAYPLWLPVPWGEFGNANVYSEKERLPLSETFVVKTEYACRGEPEMWRPLGQLIHRKGDFDLNIRTLDFYNGEFESCFTTGIHIEVEYRRHKPQEFPLEDNLALFARLFSEPFRTNAKLRKRLDSHFLGFKPYLENHWKITGERP